MLHTYEHKSIQRRAPTPLTNAHHLALTLPRGIASPAFSRLPRPPPSRSPSVIIPLPPFRRKRAAVSPTCNERAPTKGSLHVWRACCRALGAELQHAARHLAQRGYTGTDTKMDRERDRERDKQTDNLRQTDRRGQRQRAFYWHCEYMSAPGKCPVPRQVADSQMVQERRPPSVWQ